MSNETRCAKPRCGKPIVSRSGKFGQCGAGHLSVREPTPPPSAQTSEPVMDEEQVRLNGGPPCYALLGETMPDGWPKYCGRAERWIGHPADHPFVAKPADSRVTEENAEVAFEQFLKTINLKDKWAGDVTLSTARAFFKAGYAAAAKESK